MSPLECIFTNYHLAAGHPGTSDNLNGILPLPLDSSPLLWLYCDSSSFYCCVTPSAWVPPDLGNPPPAPPPSLISPCVPGCTGQSLTKTVPTGPCGHSLTPRSFLILPRPRGNKVLPPQLSYNDQKVSVMWLFLVTDTQWERTRPLGTPIGLDLSWCWELYGEATAISVCVI